MKPEGGKIRANRDSEIRTKDTKEGGQVTQMTQIRILEICDLIAEGKSRWTVIKTIAEKYGLSEKRVQDLYYDAIKYLLPKDESQRREELILKNQKTLEQIVQNALEEKNYKEATRAIAELNKIAGVTGGVKVGVRNEGKDGNANEFIIEINQ